MIKLSVSILNILDYIIGLLPKIFVEQQFLLCTLNYTICICIKSPNLAKILLSISVIEGTKGILLLKVLLHLITFGVSVLQILLKIESYMSNLVGMLPTRWYLKKWCIVILYLHYQEISAVYLFF